MRVYGADADVCHDLLSPGDSAGGLRLQTRPAMGLFGCPASGGVYQVPIQMPLKLTNLETAAGMVADFSSFSQIV